ncbi:MAG TPA: response regulator [Spirochaetia bacterium]|nr:response regulator [Spirochaetia bacterium]HRZ66334.1 response regulator [Spirochaetia bacterium]
MPERPLVLLVEDEDSIRLSLRDYLRKKGFEVLVASDGVGAIKLLLDHEVGFIVSDYRMEVFGGDYWVKFLRKYCADKRILITSGFLHPDFEVPFEVLYKPFDYGEIAARILPAEGGSPAPGPR